ncbi:MAG TPA: hypothetical protein VFT42_03085 [Solirubrobacteraceae bacterium]|nr:hypothetical protein [Solirubrobacteraceae bacterium]
MSVRLRNPAALAFLGCFLAPGGWAIQHWVGFSVNQARCNGPGRAAAPVDALTLAATVLAFVLSVIGLMSAIAAYQATKEIEEDGPPPGSRVRFMAVVGIAITPLFMCIFLMSGIGTFFLDVCRQS